MPKDEKHVGKKKRSKATPGKQSNSTPKVKKRKVEKIARSKQLEAKLTKSRPRQRKSLVDQPRSSGRRTCGKPMPSLAELERMFGTSSEDEANGPSTSSAHPPSRCNTPEKPIVIGVEQLASPSTLRKYSEKVIDFISNLPETIVIDEDPPSPPPKTRKKPDVAYIERTKDSDQLVGYKSHAVVGAGDNIKRKFRDTDISDIESPKGKKYKSQIKDPCTSIFNSQAEEIAAKLKAVEAAETLSNSSSDSNKTIPYAGTPLKRICNFSPLPSTSTDTETFLKNDDRFNESLINETFNKSFAFNENDSVHNDNDTAAIHSFVKKESENDLEIVEVPCETIIVDDERSNGCSNSSEIQIVETKSEKPIVIEDTIGDLYSSIINLDDYCDNDVCEVIDVDDIIAQNKAVLKKYKTKAPKSINYVDLNISHNETTSNVKDTRSIIETSVSRKPHKDPIENIEVIDVDDIIAQNKAVLKKDKTKAPKSITYVDLNISHNETTSNVKDTRSIIETSVSRKPHKDPIENIVKVFFKNHLLSKPDTKTYLETVYNALVKCTDSIAKSFGEEPLKTPNPHPQSLVINPVTDIPGLDQLPNNNSLHVTSQHASNPSDPVNSMTEISQRSNALSAINSSRRNIVVLQNNEPDFINPPTYQRTRGRAKNQTIKTKQPIAVTPVPPSPTTDERENQPPRRLGDCPICMENLSNLAIASTICGHLFCMPCIKAALKSSGKKCPTCRKSLKAVGYHQIFI